MIELGIFNASFDLTNTYKEDLVDLMLPFSVCNYSVCKNLSEQRHDKMTNICFCLCSQR